MKTVKKGLCDDMRKYFRVNDMVSFSYKVLSWADARLLQENTIKKPMHRFMIKTNLERLSRELQPLHKVINSSNSNVAQYLATLDKKISLLSECLLEDDEDDSEIEVQEVNIGGGGLMFFSEKAINVGAMIETKMRLMPEDRKIFSYARVVSCSRLEDQGPCQGYKIAVEFKFMDDDVRDLITRHVLLKEQELINK